MSSATRRAWLDLYADAYSGLTMYGYSAKGETKKRSLEIGDAARAQLLYGIPQQGMSRLRGRAINGPPSILP